MSIEIVDEAFPVGSRESDGARGARRVVSETIQLGSSEAREERGDGVSDEVITIGGRGGRALSANAKRMLDNIDKHGSVEDRTAETPTAETVSPTVPAGTADAGAPQPASPAATTPAGTAAASDPAPAEAATATDPAAEHIARAEKLAEHNRRLAMENETLRKRPTRGELSAREKALDEAERTYIDDPVSAVRRLVATALGVDDPKSKEVDAELTGLYQDLTERELSVSLDPVQKATREAARTRRLLERDKRERKAETDAAAAKPTDDPEAQQTAETVAIIDSRLASGKHVEQYPLMMNLSSDFDGMKPSELLWKSIKRGIATGELDPKASDEQLIDTVSKQIENHYQALADKIGKARPQTSTAATTTQASPATDSKAEPQGNGPRTITNASASVAPATPPAKKTEPTTDTPPKYRNEAERRKALAARHFGS